MVSFPTPTSFKSILRRKLLTYRKVCILRSPSIQSEKRQLLQRSSALELGTWAEGKMYKEKRFKINDCPTHKQARSRERLQVLVELISSYPIIYLDIQAKSPAKTQNKRIQGSYLFVIGLNNVEMLSLEPARFWSVVTEHWPDGLDKVENRREHTEKLSFWCNFESFSLNFFFLVDISLVSPLFFSLFTSTQ